MIVGVPQSTADDPIVQLVLAHYWVWLGFTAALCIEDNPRQVAVVNVLMGWPSC